MDMTSKAIDNDRVVWLLLLGVLFLGLTTFLNMPRSESPPFIIRNATIVTYMTGASPERVERLVTSAVESTVREMPEVSFVAGTSMTGVSVVTIAVQERYTNLEPIWTDLRRRVGDVSKRLPAEASTPEVNTNLGDVYEVSYTMVGEGFTPVEMYSVAKEMRDAFLEIRDVAQVKIVGAQDERVFVEYDNATLAKLGLSPLALQSMLGAQNITMPGGQLYTDQETILIEPTGSFESVDEIRDTMLRIGDREELVTLGDIATVRRGTLEPARALVFANGEPCLTLSVSMRAGGNILEMDAELAKVRRRLLEDYPIGIELEQIVAVPEQVDETIQGFVSNLLQSVTIVLLVMLAFLGIRTGVIVVTLVPTTMLLTITLMGLLDIGLDQVSLAALIIALGMLVDNAIVIAESVLVRMEEGATARRAAIESAAELRVPLLVSSLTTSAAFLPIYLAESAVGEFTSSLFKVVSLALLSSWLLSMTMIPMFCVLFMKAGRTPKEEVGEPTGLLGAYRVILSASLRRRWVTLLLTGAAFVGAMSLFGALPKIFFPNSAATYFTVHVEMPTGTPIERTAEVAARIDAFVTRELRTQETGRVVSWGTFVGESLPAWGLGQGGGVASPDHAMLMINVDTPEFQQEAIRRLDRWGAENLPDARLMISGATNGPGGGTPVAVRVTGRNLDDIFTVVGEVSEQLRSIEGTSNVRNDWGLASKKLLIVVDQERARRAGITSQDVAISLQTNFTGLTVTEYREGDDAIPVTMRSDASGREDLGKLETLEIQAQQSGRAVPLLQIARVQLDFEFTTRLRRDGVPKVAVFSELDPGYTANSVTTQLVPWLDSKREGWPSGVTIEVGGENESSADANESIVEKLPFAALLILVLLVSQFNSMRRAGIILMTIPLAMIGVVPGLLVFGQSFGFMTLLGIISLAGIVINNAIVLIDRIDIEIRVHQKLPWNALLDAGTARLRPIVLTTITTVCGMIPLYLGGGALWESMAMAIIAGLIVSTVLTLVVVPTLYAIFFGVRRPDGVVGPGSPVSADEES